MFMSGILSGATLNSLDPEQERDPPAPPTPITFPALETFGNSEWIYDSPPPRLQSLFSRVTKPTDIGADHIKALNVQLSLDCTPEDLLPSTPDGGSYLPALSNDGSGIPHSYAEATKTDAAAAKKRKEFDDRLLELRLDNDSGYRVITRKPKPGQKPPRLGYMRKFWEGLESMSQYWDTSLDKYYEVKPETPDVEGESEQDRKRLRLDSSQTSQVNTPFLDNDSGETPHDTPMTDADVETKWRDGRIGAATEQLEGLETNNDGDLGRVTMTPSPTPSSPKLRYKGRRTGTGRDMPDQFRTDTVRAFVEGAVWAFQFQVAAPRHMPMVQMNKLNLPVRQTAAVYRVPRERPRARGGFLEGPVFTIQVRPETEFAENAGDELSGARRARLDLMRELGGLLQCAQERNRQGKTEVLPGEGKWWTTKPRWGGGPGGEVENRPSGNSDEGVKDVLQMAEEMVGKTTTTFSRPILRKKKTPAMLWKELKCGSRVWDSKTDYEAVGKEAGSEYDEVFMVSSLNHHIAILKFTVHTAYNDFIRTDEVPNPLPSDPNWSSPQLQRTRWYDLFDIEQRVEAFRTLWGVTAYLMREASSPNKTGATDEEKSKEV